MWSVYTVVVVVTSQAFILNILQDKCHFTSYWRYCFLHSGVIWDERCSANFILPEQVSLQTSVKSESGCPLPRRRDFCYVSQLAGSTCGASGRRTPLPSHSTCNWSHSVHKIPHTVPSHILFHRGSCFLLNRWSGCSFKRADESRSVTLLGPSLGWSGDTAVRHRNEPQWRGCVSRARSGIGGWWDLLKTVCSVHICTLSFSSCFI